MCEWSKNKVELWYGRESLLALTFPPPKTMVGISSDDSNNSEELQADEGRKSCDLQDEQRGIRV